MSNWRATADLLGLPFGRRVLAASYIPIPGWYLFNAPDEWNQYHFMRYPFTRELLWENIVFDPGTPSTSHFPAGWNVVPDH